MPPSPPFNVLLVEDNPGDALLTRALLDGAAPGGMFRVTHVERLGDAVTHLARDGSDVVLLDLGLPDAFGVEAVSGLLDVAPDLPLVVLSGHDDERLALEAVLRGAQDYLIKGRSDRALMRRAIRYAIERKRAERRLHFLAKHDPLTGLANRVLFQDRIVQALRRLGDGRDRLIGLIFIDLDGFKPVNDRYGHEVGDMLLRAVAKRLIGAVRRTDTVARMGGDEFTVILEGLHRRADAVRVAEKVLATLATPFDVSGTEITVSASLGVALAERADEDADSLIRRADAAMYQAKAGGGHRFELHDGPAAFGLPPARRAVA